jgi:nicotinate-nucleotide--dimethylbenzimidazole phosphoribosyltransferase
MISGLPLDDLRNLLARLPEADSAAAGLARARNDALRDSGFETGRAGALAEWLAAWSGRHPPKVGRGVVCLFVGTHPRGTAGRHSPGFERRFVEHASAGGAPVNQLCGSADLGLKIFDLALEVPIGDITVEPALDERACAATVAFGMEAIAGSDLLCLGGLGEGGQASAAALMTVLAGGKPADWLEGAEPAAEESAAAEAALGHHGQALKDPLEALRRLGGREVSAIAGAIVAARMERVPVILDGWAALVAAGVLHAARPGAVAHCLVADASTPARERAARMLGLEAAIGWGGDGGDGAAAAMAAIMVKNAALLHEGTVPLPLG